MKDIEMSFPITAPELEMLLKTRGCGGHASKKLEEFCRVYVASEGKKSQRAYERMSGASYPTILKWVKASREIVEDLRFHADPSASVSREALDLEEKKRREAQERQQRHELELQKAIEADSNTPAHQIIDTGGQVADHFRAKIRDLSDMLLSKDPETLSTSDIRNINESLCKIIPGMEAPKQSVSVQVLVGQEGANRAERKLVENIKWLDERGELPADLKAYFDEKYRPRGPDIVGEVEEAIIADDDST